MVDPSTFLSLLGFFVVAVLFLFFFYLDVYVLVNKPYTNYVWSIPTYCMLGYGKQHFIWGVEINLNAV